MQQKKQTTTSASFKPDSSRGAKNNKNARKAQQRINLLTLVKVGYAIIHSRLEHTAQIFGNAAKTNLPKLQIVFAHSKAAPKKHT